MVDLVDIVQKQEIITSTGDPDTLVELFDIIINPNSSSPQKYYIFNGLEDGTDQVEFNQNNYVATPIQIGGREFSSTGAQQRPALSIANIPRLTKNVAIADVYSASEEVLESIRRAFEFESNDDFVGTKVIHHSTLLSNCNTNSANAAEFPAQTYYIEKVASETNLIAVFELATPLDIEGARVPARNVIGTYCVWHYQGRGLKRGGGCSWPLNGTGDSTGSGRCYAGENIFNASGTLLHARDSKLPSIAAWNASSTYSVGDLVMTLTSVDDTTHKQIWQSIRAQPAGTVNRDPRESPLYWKRVDYCSKTLTGCKNRFQGNNSDNTLDQSKPLPFGGFPGSKKYK